MELVKHYFLKSWFLGTQQLSLSYRNQGRIQDSIKGRGAKYLASRSGILFMGYGINFTKLSVIENLYPFFYNVIFLFQILYFAPLPLGAPKGGAKYEL